MRAGDFISIFKKDATTVSPLSMILAGIFVTVLYLIEEDEFLVCWKFFFLIKNSCWILRLLYDCPFFKVNLVNNIDFWILNWHCISEIKPAWLWYIVLFLKMDGFSVLQFCSDVLCLTFMEDILGFHWLALFFCFLFCWFLL